MKTAVVVYGRFQPPTIGHEKLINALVATSQRENGTPFVYASHTQDSKNNPLTHKQKFTYLSKMFPSLKRSLQSSSTIRTLLDIMGELHEKKFNKLILVVCSDRVSDFNDLLNRYNGVKSKHKFYEFEEIKVVSAGERDPDSTGVSNVSATKLRTAATQGDFKTFLLGVSSTLKTKDAKNMMNDIRKGLKLDVILERMKQRRGSTDKIRTEKNTNIVTKEFIWQGYETLNISTCHEAFELYDEIINSIMESTFTRPEMLYLKESLMMTDNCLSIFQMSKRGIITEEDICEYVRCSDKAIKLLDLVGGRIGLDFNYSFLNNFQIELMGEHKIVPITKKLFTQFSGDMYGI